LMRLILALAFAWSHSVRILEDCDLLRYVASK
jgi:hypothetical protein